MPIHERIFFGSKGAPATIVEDRACQRCSCNLVGLKVGDRCPECGTPITGGGASRFTSTMAGAPIAYLTRLRNGAMIMGIGGAMLLFAVVMSIIINTMAGPSMLAPLFGIAAAMCWCLGLWIVTEPCQDGSKEGIEGRTLWSLTRHASRWTQAAWIFAMVFLLVAAALQQQAQAAFAARVAATPGAFAVGQTAAHPALAIWLTRLALILWFTGIIGIGVIAIHLARLADWAHDTALAARLRMAPLLVVVAAPLGLLTLAVVRNARPGISSFLAVPVGGVSALLLLGCIGAFVVVFMQFVSLCGWARTSAITRTDRDARMSDRISRRIQSAQARDGAAYVPPGWAEEAQHTSGARGNYMPSSQGATFEIAPEEPKK